MSPSAAPSPRRLFVSRRPSAGAVTSMALLGGLFGAACIMRTAPPPTAGGAPAGAAEKPSAADEAANARIAGLARADLLGGAGTKAFHVSGETAKVDMSIVPVAGQPFSEAMRLDVKDGSDHEWAVQLEASNTAAIASGDALLATFFVRTEKPQEGGIGETEFVFELGRAPYSKSVQYPVPGAPDWVRVQARFKAAQAYAAGEAHILFRLGYDPQTILLGGVTVENFGKSIAFGLLPSTQGADRRREREAAAAIKQAQAVPAAPVEGGELAIEIAPAQVIRPISPYVYGINSQAYDGVGATVRRMGGNRQTGYNWENNASNAGSDYNHSSDEWPCSVLGFRDCSVPGAQFLDFANVNRGAGLETVATVPLVDYVTADKNGPVHENEKAPSKRWNRSLPVKPGPFTLTPDLSDGVVYEDEFVNLLVQKLGKAAAGGIKFYSLDNEPALWPSTHPRIHPDKTTYKEMVTRTEATAGAITKVDPSAVVLGAVAFGWSEYRDLQGAPDAAAAAAKGDWYLDVLLSEMKRLEAEHHHRLVHVLDVHWYPEAKGSKRITDKDLSAKTVAARLQAPRSLWDPTYVEKSWIAAEWKKPIRLIPWLREKIALRYPGTELGITEYDYGAGDHISGGLAQADVLGVLGREGAYLANYWGSGPANGGLPKYVKAAFQLYRNYDGKNGAFGDTAVIATPADQTKASVFAATDSKHPGRLTVLVINKDLNASFDGKIDIKGDAKAKAKVATYTKAQVFALDGSGATIRALPAVDVKDNHIATRLPPLSATLFVCEE